MAGAGQRVREAAGRVAGLEGAEAADDDHRACGGTYGFELSDDRVEEEWLHAYPKGTRESWFPAAATNDSCSPMQCILAPATDNAGALRAR
ncbi:hypothetical protein ACVWXU_003181 [Streptomyces sp. TE33382]